MLVETPPQGFVLPGLLTAGRIDVVDDGAGYGERIASRLNALGVDAHLVAHVSANAGGVIFARGLRAVPSQDEAIAVQRDALQAARTLATRQGERVLVTLQDTGGDFGLSGRAGERAWTGGIAGLAKTAAAEWPDAAVKAIDISCAGAPADAVADRIISELFSGGREVEVALARNGKRAVVHHRPAAYAPIGHAATAHEKSRVRPGSVVLVSGGARGVTAAALMSICKYRPRLALLGRTELVEERTDTRPAATDADLRRALLARARSSAGVPPNPKELAREAKRILDCREINESLAALRRAGAEVSYHAVDVRDAGEVRSALDAVRRAWGPIRGIIHGAGVLADALLAAQTDEQFDLVFATKVGGLRHLLAATAEDPIELLITFASVAGRFGNAAQAAYAMANEVLSCVAASESARRGPRCLVRSLAWGPWAGGMVTPGLARMFEKAGVQLLALDAGTAAFAREVESGDDWAQVILMNGTPPDTARPLDQVWAAPDPSNAGAVGGRPFRGEKRFDILVNATTHPFLDGHRITGVPVVPAVMVLKWFSGAASACCPSLSVLACRDMKVLRGVRVDAFDGPGSRLVVHARGVERSGAGATLEMDLLDEQGKLRYTGVVEMGAGPAAPPSFPEPPASGNAWPWSVDEAYSDVLFHRGPFATIQSLDAVSEGGASGRVAGPRVVGCEDAGWWADVAVIDGGVQIAVLWGRIILGRLPLPTRIGAFHLDGRVPVDSPVRCIVRGRREGQYSAIADLAYLDGQGSVIGYIQDLELHLAPSVGR